MTTFPPRDREVGKGRREHLPRGRENREGQEQEQDPSPNPGVTPHPHRPRTDDKPRPSDVGVEPRTSTCRELGPVVQRRRVVSLMRTVFFRGRHPRPTGRWLPRTSSSAEPRPRLPPRPVLIASVSLRTAEVTQPFPHRGRLQKPQFLKVEDPGVFVQHNQPYSRHIVLIHSWCVKEWMDE